MTIIQATLTSLFSKEKENIEDYTLEDILNIYKTESIKVGLDLDKFNAGYDFYHNIIYIWLETDCKRIESKATRIQKRINKSISKSKIRIDTTIMSDWAGLPLPKSYSSFA